MKANKIKESSVEFARWLMMFDIDYIDSSSKGELYRISGFDGHHTLDEIYEMFTLYKLSKKYRFVEIPEDAKKLTVNIWSDDTTTLEFLSDNYEMEYDTIDYSGKDYKEITLDVYPVTYKIITSDFRFLDNEVLNFYVKYYKLDVDTKRYCVLRKIRDGK